MPPPLPPRREPLPYGYRCYTGTVPRDHEIDRYNRLQATINRWIDAGRQPPEVLLIDSHRAFCDMARVAPI